VSSVLSRKLSEPVCGDRQAFSLGTLKSVFRSEDCRGTGKESPSTRVGSIDRACWTDAFLERRWQLPLFRNPHPMPTRQVLAAPDRMCSPDTLSIWHRKLFPVAMETVLGRVLSKYFPLAHDVSVPDQMSEEFSSWRFGLNVLHCVYKSDSQRHQSC
jgi:hypothetical protein